MTEQEALDKLSEMCGYQYTPMPGTTVITNEHGFLSYIIYDSPLGRVFYLEGLYAPHDGKYWDDFTMNLARQNNCQHMLITTIRSPKALAKKYGYKIQSYVMTKEVV